MNIVRKTYCPPTVSTEHIALGVHGFYGETQALMIMDSSVFGLTCQLAPVK